MAKLPLGLITGSGAAAPSGIIGFAPAVPFSELVFLPDEDAAAELSPDDDEEVEWEKYPPGKDLIPPAEKGVVWVVEAGRVAEFNDVRRDNWTMSGACIDVFNSLQDAIEYVCYEHAIYDPSNEDMGWRWHWGRVSIEPHELYMLEAWPNADGFQNGTELIEITKQEIQTRKDLKYYQNAGFDSLESQLKQHALRQAEKEAAKPAIDNSSTNPLP